MKLKRKRTPICFKTISVSWLKITWNKLHLTGCDSGRQKLNAWLLRIIQSDHDFKHMLYNWFFSFKSCWLLKIFSPSAVFLYLNGGKTNPYLYSRALVEILHRLRNIELYETRALFLWVFFQWKKLISFQVKHVCTGRWHSVLQEALPGDSGCQEHTDSRLIA